MLDGFILTRKYVQHFRNPSGETVQHFPLSEHSENVDGFSFHGKYWFRKFSENIEDSVQLTHDNIVPMGNDKGRIAKEGAKELEAELGIYKSFIDGNEIVYQSKADPDLEIRTHLRSVKKHSSPRTEGHASRNMAKQLVVLDRKQNLQTAKQNGKPKQNQAKQQAKQQNDKATKQQSKATK